MLAQVQQTAFPSSQIKGRLFMGNLMNRFHALQVLKMETEFQQRWLFVCPAAFKDTGAAQWSFSKQIPHKSCVCVCSLWETDGKVSTGNAEIPVRRR